MSLGINQCNFAGYLGKDPEVKTTNSGVTRTTFTLAVSESWKDKNGAKQENTEWLNVQAWRKQAELIGQYFKKGDPIFITGKYRTREYEDKEGVTQRYRFIELREFSFLPNPKRDGADACWRRCKSAGIWRIYLAMNRRFLMLIPESRRRLDDDDVLYLKELTEFPC